MTPTANSNKTTRRRGYGSVERIALQPSFAMTVTVNQQPSRILDYRETRGGVRFENLGDKPVALSLSPRAFGNCSIILEANGGKIELFVHTGDSMAKYGFWAVTPESESQVRITEYELVRIKSPLRRF